MGHVKFCRAPPEAIDSCQTALRDGGAKLFARICHGKQVVRDLWQNVFKGRSHFRVPNPRRFESWRFAICPFELCPVQ